jgi:hypothetical protein
MREPLRDRERLAHIITAADNIARYTEGSCRISGRDRLGRMGKECRCSEGNCRSQEYDSNR